jgi:iron complex transport system substrate-binding protein
MKRTLALMLALVALAAALAGCGDDDDGSTAASTTAGPAGSDPTTTTGETDGPVTIEHRYGTTTFDAAPERIVSLDQQWTDVLVALEAPLVAASDYAYIDGGRFPWQDVIPTDVETIAMTDAIPYEAVAAQRPDLIVITYLAVDQTTYDQLAAIAPTIGPLGEAEVDAWEDIATVAGEVLGDTDAAAALIAEADERNAAIRDELPGLEGKTYALANYVPGDAIYVVADPDDGASQVFADIGLVLDPDLVAIADGASGRAKLSLEQIGLLDADLLVLLTNGADPNDIPGYAALPAVESGAVAILDLAQVTGLNTPTPLALPYALDAIRPALEAVAAA